MPQAKATACPVQVTKAAAQAVVSSVAVSITPAIALLGDQHAVSGELEMPDNASVATSSGASAPIAMSLPLPQATSGSPSVSRHVQTWQRQVETRRAETSPRLDLSRFVMPAAPEEDEEHLFAMDDV